MKLTIQDALEKDKSQYPHALLRSIPPKLCFLFFLRPVPPWVSLLCAWAKVKHLPLSWSKPVQVSTFNISFLLFFCRYTLICLPPEPSLCAWNINEPLWLSWGELCSDSPPLLRVLLLLPVIQKDAEGVKPRCVWCWVRAGYERIQEPKDECKKKEKRETKWKGGKNPGWQNLKKKKMSEAPISLNKRLTDGSSLGRWEINTKIIKLK